MGTATLDEIFGDGTAKRLKSRNVDEKVLGKIRLHYNPGKEPVGDYTGRCDYCHSDDLWDDATMYGCNDCGKMNDNSCVRLVPNGSQVKGEPAQN